MNTTTNTPATTTPATHGYRPKLRFYHANGKGTGGAVQMELHPAHDDVDGSIWVRAANQMTIGNPMGPNPMYPRFDWDGSITVKLDFADLCRMLQVFRGECESLGNDRGLIHRTARSTTRIVLRHIVEPCCGYSFELYRNLQNGGESRSHILFSPWEALGIAEAIAGSLSVISFGIPKVIPHDTSAYAAENRGARNVSAA